MLWCSASAVERYSDASENSHYTPPWRGAYIYIYIYIYIYSKYSLYSTVERWGCFREGLSKQEKLPTHVVRVNTEADFNDDHGGDDGVHGNDNDNNDRGMSIPANCS